MAAQSLTPTKRAQLVELFFVHGGYGRAANALAALHPCLKKPGKSVVFRTVKRFRETGSVHNRKKTERPRSATNDNILTNVLATIGLNPHATSREIANSNGVSQTSVLRILKRENFHPYKIKFLPCLQEADFERRMLFCEQMINNCNADATYTSLICFSDEATFYMNGRFNHQNFSWSADNPNWMREVKCQGAEK